MPDLSNFFATVGHVFLAEADLCEALPDRYRTLVLAALLRESASAIEIGDIDQVSQKWRAYILATMATVIEDLEAEP
jgi:hypothetical protein